MRTTTAWRSSRHVPRACTIRAEDHVGLGAPVLDRPHAAGAAEARLHLVDDQQAAPLPAERRHLGEHAVGQGDDAALALHGLEDDGGGAVIEVEVQQ